MLAGSHDRGWPAVCSLVVGPAAARWVAPKRFTLERPMNWAEFEQSAPDLAQQGRERFERTHVALLGTLRADGSPRISPIEPFLIANRLVIGVMRSAKGNDLARDARCTLHSSITDINGSEGEFKVFGRAVPVLERDLAGADADAWWHGRPTASSALYSIDITGATFVSWDSRGGQMSVRNWSAQGTAKETSRAYP
jgi:hypothetical protein